MRYLKPHGALYHRVLDDEEQARAVLDGSGGLPVLGMPGVLLTLATATGRPVFHEGFPDRGYGADGRLLPRSEPGALVEDEADDRRPGPQPRGAGSTRCACTATRPVRSPARSPYAERSRVLVTHFTASDCREALPNRRVGGDGSPCDQPPHPRRPRRRRPRPVPLPLAACSGSVSVGSDPQYDADKVAAEVQSAQEKVTPDLDVTDPTCPDDVDVKEGATFECTITIAGVEAPYTVTISDVGDTSAHFDIAPAKAIIYVDAAVGFLQDQADRAGSEGVTIECGDAAIIVQDPQTTFPCTLTNGGQVQDIALLIKDIDGTVSIDSAS